MLHNETSMPLQPQQQAPLGPHSGVQSNAFDVSAVRRDFPMLAHEVNGKPLVYLDSAATAQKPRAVIDRMAEFYQHEYATVRRGVYGISQQATACCDLVRERCRSFLNATTSSEIIFTKGTTEALNLIAATYGRQQLRPGDNIIISTIEHHANIVPWQELCREKNALLRVIPINDRGELELEAYEHLLDARTKIVAIGHISNALGTINPIREMIRRAHHIGASVVIDGAQGVLHQPTDVQALDCDFYTFSGHKTFGPTGIGVLYGKQRLLDIMPPYQFGGDMIEAVSFEKTTFAPSPAKFEAGTPPIAQIIGLGEALAYVENVGRDRIMRYEHELLDKATQALSTVPGVKIIGTAREKASILSFMMDHVHPHDIGTILDQEGIALRAGHHCAMPTMKRFGIPATARVSFALYNTQEEIDLLVKGLEKVHEVFRL